jgi:hypothetical protein
MTTIPATLDKSKPKMSAPMLRALRNALSQSGPPTLLRTGGENHVDGMTRKALRARGYVAGENDEVTDLGREAVAQEEQRLQAAAIKATPPTPTPVFKNG